MQGSSLMRGGAFFGRTPSSVPAHHSDLERHSSHGLIMHSSSLEFEASMDFLENATANERFERRPTFTRVRQLRNYCLFSAFTDTLTRLSLAISGCRSADDSAPRLLSTLLPGVS